MSTQTLINALNSIQSKCVSPESVFCALVASASYVEPGYQDNFVFVMTTVLTGGFCDDAQLNLICEFNPYYIKELKAETGLHIGQLRQLAQTGGLTSKVITAALLRHKNPVIALQPGEIPMNPPLMREYH